MEINISNSKNRDAPVQALPVQGATRIRWVDSLGRQARSVNVLKATVDIDGAALAAKAGGVPGIAQLLIDGDPEIDIEKLGSFLPSLTRIYIDVERRIVHKVKQLEVIKTPEGVVRDRRPRKQPPPNIGAEQPPLRWSGRMIKKAEAVARYVFVSKLQLAHVNGLTYDFLYAMAQELEKADSLMLLNAGPKSNQPLILRRGGTPHRGFLEGRTQGDRYCLVLHLSNLELKAPEAPKDEAEPAAEGGA